MGLDCSFHFCFCGKGGVKRMSNVYRFVGTHFVVSGF